MNRERTAKKLKEIFKMGYLPSRRSESYYVKLPNGYCTARLGNCLEHACFNLKNEQFYKYNFDFEDMHAFQEFMDPNKNLKEITHDIFNFVESCGLEVRQAKSILKQKNEWKVALYFRTCSMFGDDYHFLLQEKSGVWTGKMGNGENLQRYFTLRKSIRDYDLYGVYTIKNPNAKPDKTL